MNTKFQLENFGRRGRLGDFGVNKAVTLNSRRVLGEIECECLEWIRLVGCCERGNELSGFVKGG